jgi:iron(III) transport system permease protein
MTPVVMIIVFSFQNWASVRAKVLNPSEWTLINYFGTQDYQYVRSSGKTATRYNAISGVFSNEKTVAGIRLSFILAAVAAALACVIVVIAVNYIFKHRNKKRAVIVEACLLFPWLLPTILICYSYRIYFNQEVWYVFSNNLYYRENVIFLIIMAYAVVKLPFALRMVKAAFYAIDDELEEAARNLGASGLVSFLRVKLPIVLPSVLAVFALNFNALFTEYDMSATFASKYGKTYAMVIQSMTMDEGLYGYNVNASGRRCASTVFIMIVSGIILWLVYGVGARDLSERLEARKKRRERFAKIFGKKKLKTEP